MAQIQLEGGPFQDALGNPLANGFLVLRLQHDAAIAGTGILLGNLTVQVNLNSSGSIPLSPAVNIWPNDQMTPAGTTYLMWAYDANNRPVFDNPQVVSITGSSPFNLNSFSPGP